MQNSINPPVCSKIFQAMPSALSPNMLLASCLFYLLFCCFSIVLSNYCAMLGRGDFDCVVITVAVLCVGELSGLCSYSGTDYWQAVCCG